MTVLEQNISLEEMVKENTKLVHYSVKKYTKRAKKLNVDYDDLVSEGMIGLIKAIKRFDSSFGVKFSTYAVPMIQGTVSLFLRGVNPGPKFGRSAKELASKLTDEESLEEIIEKFEVTKRVAEEALAFKANQFAASLEKPIGNDEGKDVTIADIIPVQEDFSKIHIEEFLEVLPKESMRSIARGLMAAKTQAEIGQEIGVSQVHVSRQIQQIKEHYFAFERGGLKVSRKVNIQKEDYDSLKSQGLTEREIADKLGVSTATLWNHRSKWSESSSVTSTQPDTEERKTPDGKTTKEDKTAEYEALIAKLKEKIERYENMKSACDDVESELEDVNKDIRRLEKENQVLRELAKVNAMVQLEFL